MSEHSNKTVKELRKFGFAFTGGLTLLGSLLLWRGKAPGPYVLGAAAVVLTLALLAPAALRPLEKLLATISRGLTRSELGPSESVTSVTVSRALRNRICPCVA